MSSNQPPTNGPQPSPPPDPQLLTYEQAIEQVEAIADRIEAGEIGLEESIKAYERGMALLKRCRDVLDQAEQRVRNLTAEELGPDSPE